MAHVDITGHRFGRLVVLSLTDPTPSGGRKWLCRCDCGRTAAVQGVNLKSGHTTSCGCFQRERISKRSTTHGYSKNYTVHPVYSVWCTMHARCSNPKNANFHLYGGRGITVCKRWAKFENFIADMGPRPPRTSLERKDNDSGYGPGNCVWASLAAQARNRRTTLYIEIGGEKKSLADLVPAGLSYRTVWRRIHLGWPVSEIFGPLRRQPST